MLTWTVTIPRSGGIYPFGSRILPPSVAFMLSVVESLAWLFFCAIAAYWVVTIGLIPMFTVIAAVTGDSGLTDVATFLSHKGITFLLGAIVLLLAGGILTSGMRRYFLSQKIIIVSPPSGRCCSSWCCCWGPRTRSSRTSTRTSARRPPMAR